MVSNKNKTHDSFPPRISSLGTYALLAALLWSLAISLSLFVNHRQRALHLKEIGITIARASFDKDVLYRRWNAADGGVYGAQSENTPPNPYLDVPERDITTPSGKRLTLINPAYMTRQVHELGMLKNGVQGHITSLKPIRPANQPDPWEVAALERFELGEKEVSSIETFRGQIFLRYMKPLFVEQGCMKCHAKQGYKVGMIRGGISQSVPMSLVESISQGTLWPLWTGHLVLWAIGLGFISVGYSELAKRSRALQNSREMLLQSNIELKASQSKLLQSEKMASVGQLAAGVAHEINNPLGFISQNLRSLQKYVEKLTSFISAQKKALADCPDHDPEDLRQLEKKLKLDYLVQDVDDLIEESLDGTDRVQTIVKNLKTFSRVDQNDLQKVDLNECIEGALNILWNELKYKTTVEKDYGELPALNCYPQQLGQVFMNLLINASHAIDTKGVIRLKSWADDNSVHISIKDNGGGIPGEIIPRIFEPFFTTKEVGKGTGLGLSMVYDIIKNHQGEIWVESEVGKGTEFTIDLPLG